LTTDLNSINIGGDIKEERMKAFRSSPEFKEIEKALMEYLKQKEDLFSPESPMPSLKEAWGVTPPEG
jgi:hypothetical protein